MRAHRQEVTGGRWSGHNVGFVTLVVLLMSVGFSDMVAAECLDEERKKDAGFSLQIACRQANIVVPPLDPQGWGAQPGTGKSPPAH